MSTNFYSLSVKEVKKETPDTVSVLFEVPVKDQEAFSFAPGQYLVMEQEIHGEAVRRSYSICSSPLDDEWRVAIKEIPEGKFSTFANQDLKEGDRLQVMPPMGNFKIDLDTVASKNYVAFAAGSGITPILSMIKAVLAKEPNSTFTLFYGNKSFDYIIFREELEALKNTYLDRFSVHHIFSREKLGSPLFYGRIDGDKCVQFSKALFSVEETDGYYLCGPAAMIFSVKDALVSLGVEESDVHFELFNTDGVVKESTSQDRGADYDPASQSLVTIVLDDDNTEIPINYGGENILDAAINHGVDLPFACKGGVCSTCKAKVKEGDVEMMINYALEPDELAAGYVLTCQSHPRSPKVVVSFDE